MPIELTKDEVTEIIPLIKKYMLEDLRRSCHQYDLTF